MWWQYGCVCMRSHTFSMSMDQPGNVTNPARGQLKRENEYFPVRVRAWEFGLVRRVRQSRPASACSSSYSGWIWCLLTGFLPISVPAFIYLLKPPYAIGSVTSLSGHAFAYRWRSLPRVRRRGTSKPQGSSERVLPWQVTIDQLIFASLSHTHYWYEVGMLKVPAVFVHVDEPFCRMVTVGASPRRFSVYHVRKSLGNRIKLNRIESNPSKDME